MRVIAGEAKGRRLKCPKGTAVRPTSDRVREAIFSIVADKVRGARVLDLYAGAGTLGIEALSRGSDSAVFVEQSPKVASVLRENLEKCGVGKRASVALRRVSEYVKRGPEQADRFDLIFLDPPYRIADAEVEEALKGLVEQGFLRDGGLIVLERSARSAILETAPLIAKGTRVYGDTSITIFEKRAV